jgi:hypothetical protein
MSSQEILSKLLNKFNNDPFNPKKIYFNFKEIVDIDKSIILEIKLGSSESNSYVFKKYVEDKSQKEEDKEELHYTAICEILKVFYNYIDN